MSRAPSPARRIAGWTCIALGKVGSLMLLWALLTSSDTARADGASIVDSALVTVGVLPALLSTLGILALGLWLLLDSEGLRQPHGY